MTPATKHPMLVNLLKEHIIMLQIREVDGKIRSITALAATAALHAISYKKQSMTQKYQTLNLNILHFIILNV